MQKLPFKISWYFRKPAISPFQTLTLSSPKFILNFSQYSLISFSLKYREIVIRFFSSLAPVVGSLLQQNQLKN